RVLYVAIHVARVTYQSRRVRTPSPAGRERAGGRVGSPPWPAPVHYIGRVAFASLGTPATWGLGCAASRGGTPVSMKAFMRIRSASMLCLGSRPRMVAIA